MPCWDPLCAIHLESVQCIIAFVVRTLALLPFILCYACIPLLSDSVKVSLGDFFPFLTILKVLHLNLALFHVSLMLDVYIIF